MVRSLIWLQLLVGWLPIWVLFTVLVMTAHRSGFAEAALISLRMIGCAAVLTWPVHRLLAHAPWPHPFRMRFVVLQVLAASTFAACWMLLNLIVEALIRWRVDTELGPGLVPYLVTGVWLYISIAGVTYANRATTRAAEIQAQAAQSQLAALRSQVHPHFLFNALHTVTQLIASAPREAERAAELLGESLRTVIDDPRELIELGTELKFVDRYLTLEGMRFGDRLRKQLTIDPDDLDLLIPSFALQTLVENAIRHGLSPKVGPTEIRISAAIVDDRLHIRVEDDGLGLRASDGSTSGTGLKRLRERLQVLYGGQASLTVKARVPQGCEAELVLPATTQWPP